VLETLFEAWVASRKSARMYTCVGTHTCTYVFLLPCCNRSHLCRTVFSCNREFLSVWLI